ncbi:MAG: hypothetical protein KUG69_06145, partial [Marinosulfonomonas sp.]|nr:hypothetical protein [Marinosulfonomonas sp.]
EVFYTFTWGGNRPARREADTKSRRPQPKKQGKPGQRAKGRRPEGRDKPKTFSARPPKPEKQIDPDNPFAAALMGLKDKT